MDSISLLTNTADWWIMSARPPSGMTWEWGVSRGRAAIGTRAAPIFVGPFDLNMFQAADSACRPGDG